MAWTIGTLLQWTKQYFGEKGVDNPRLDAEVLLSHVLGKDRLYLYVHFDEPLEPKELAEFRELVKRRALRWPISYITGMREFMGLDFSVTPDVLIPRPDTEILVETAANRMKLMDKGRILDLGTGSGAIIVSLLKEFPFFTGVAVDISAAALEVAKGNAKKHGVEERLVFLEGDLWEPVPKEERFELILSNPPYIAAEEMGELTPEVRREPMHALTDGGDGLAFYRRIIGKAACYLTPGGMLAMEVGYSQADKVAALAELDTGLVYREIIKDYGGNCRVVVMEAARN